MKSLCLLVLLLSMTLTGCLDSFWGCPDRLINVTASPRGNYRAITRECGCTAEAGTYISIFIVPRGHDETCQCQNLAVASVRSDSPAGVMHAYWEHEKLLRVKLSGIDRPTLKSYPSLPQPSDWHLRKLQAKYANEPKISIDD